jgi:hypothetical protein
VRPFHVAAWIEDFPGAKPTVKLKLAAVRMLYDFLVVRQITRSNPAHSVRGPKVCRQERQNACLEPRRRQGAVGFHSQGFGVRLTGPGAYRGDVLQLRPCERGTEGVGFILRLIGTI